MTNAEFKAYLTREFNGDIKLPDDNTLADLSKEALLEIGRVCDPAYMLMHSNDTLDGDKIFRSIGNKIHVRLPDKIDFSKADHQVILDDDLMEALALLMCVRMLKDQTKKSEFVTRARNALGIYKNNQLNSDNYQEVMGVARNIASINLLGFFENARKVVEGFDKKIKNSEYYLGVENGCRCSDTETLTG